MRLSLGSRNRFRDWRRLIESRMDNFSSPKNSWKDKRGQTRKKLAVCQVLRRKFRWRNRESRNLSAVNRRQPNAIEEKKKSAKRGSRKKHTSVGWKRLLGRQRYAERLNKKEKRNRHSKWGWSKSHREKVKHNSVRCLNMIKMKLLRDSMRPRNYRLRKPEKMLV